MANDTCTPRQLAKYLKQHPEERVVIKMANEPKDMTDGELVDGLFHVVPKSLFYERYYAELLSRLADGRSAMEILERIAYPLKYLQSEADKTGSKLDGFNAVSLIDDAGWLKGMAKVYFEHYKDGLWAEVDNMKCCENCLSHSGNNCYFGDGKARPLITTTVCPFWQSDNLTREEREKMTPEDRERIAKYMDWDDNEEHCVFKWHLFDLNDAGLCVEKMVEIKDWEKFLRWLRYPDNAPQFKDVFCAGAASGAFIAWLFNVDNFFTAMAAWLKWMAKD